MFKKIVNCKGPFTISVNLCVSENNASSDNKTQTQGRGSVPILCINVNFSIDTMLKSDANVDSDGKCERTLTNDKEFIHTFGAAMRTRWKYKSVGSSPRYFTRQFVSADTWRG